MRFVFQEGAFELPAETRDDSVQALAVPVAGGLPLSLTIRRRVVGADGDGGGDGQDDAAFLVAELSRLAAGDPHHETLWTRPHRVDGHDALIAAVRYGGAVGKAEQRLLLIRHGDRVLQLTASVAGDFSSTQLDALNTVVRTLRLSAEGEAGPDG